MKRMRILMTRKVFLDMRHDTSMMEDKEKAYETLLQSNQKESFWVEFFEK